MCPPPEVSPGEYSAEERSLLLKLAHDAIASALVKSEISLESPTPHLAEARGTFATLYHRGNLRGCVGHVFAASSLYRAVAETAQAAAFQDPRFDPVTANELPGLEVSLSILSPLRPILAEEVEIGKHGLLISMAGRRGLLLPQVPVEHGWNRIQFLEQTCRKAGLPSNAWQEAKLEAFTAEVFRD
ncbi:MAG TPA: AmmeMemoRadiSam system protein A [Terriglobales bacterium]|jgi:AmmeMemoRadiSam system protein A|nr:AmmeMemoRadiSam system protein A [Terriglobales bacterium]